MESIIAQLESELHMHTHVTFRIYYLVCTLHCQVLNCLEVVLDSDSKTRRSCMQLHTLEKPFMSIRPESCAGIQATQRHAFYTFESWATNPRKTRRK